MRVSRRNLLKGLALGSGSMLLPTMAQRILANGEGKTSASYIQRIGEEG